MKIELYYHWKQYDWQDEGQIAVDVIDRSEYDPSYLLLKIVEVEVPDCPEPSRELVIKHKTATLHAEKEKLQAETYIKIQKIEDQIRQLSALEYRADSNAEEAGD